MKFHQIWAATALGLCLVIAPAKADIITFNVSASGSPNDCPFTCTLGGDIVINTSNGSIVSANVTLTGLGPFGPFTDFGVSPIERSGTFAFFTELFIVDALSDQLHIFLPVSNLIGYPGGAICVVNDLNAFPHPCLQSEFLITVFGGSTELVSGSLTAVPGPIAGAGLPGLLLAGGGLLAWWRRKRNEPAAAT
jgi:hypothetical protein